MDQFQTAGAWVVAHWDQLAEGAGALYLLLSVVVALTPTPKDDEALVRLRRAFQRLSFLSPRDVSGWFSLPGKVASPDDERSEPEDEGDES